MVANVTLRTGQGQESNVIETCDLGVRGQKMVLKHFTGLK